MTNRELPENWQHKHTARGCACVWFLFDRCMRGNRDVTEAEQGLRVANALAGASR